MPTYKQSFTFYEDGFGEVTDVYVWSDVYTSLDDLAGAVEVNIFSIESTKHDLDVEAGVFAEDEITFSALETSIMLEADSLALDFVLDAQDATVERYVARYINPGDPVSPGDVEFRGRIRQNVSSQDVAWDGPEFTGDINPLRVWKFSAGSFEVQAILNKDLEDLINGPIVPGSDPESRSGGISSTWQTANVEDRLGYFKHEAGHADGYGFRELRFCDLVSLGTLLQELLNQAAPSGMTITFVNTDTDIYGYPARFPVADSDERRFLPTRSRIGRRLRYISNWSITEPYQVLASDRERLQTYSTGRGGIYVNYRLVKPLKGEESASWLRYKTLDELLYTLAGALGMYIKFDYASATSVSVTLASRSELTAAEVFIKGAKDAAQDIKPLQPEEAAKRKYKGDAWPHNREGQFIQYTHNGAIAVPRESMRPDQVGQALPLTLSPLTMQTSDPKAEDARHFFAESGWNIGVARLPHNSAFWDSVGGTPQRKGTEVYYNTSGIHTGIYVRTIGLDPVDDFSEGVQGLSVWAPVAEIALGAPEGAMRFTSLSDYANWIHQRDNETFYEAEYTLTLPYLCSFKATAGGAMDWRNLALGARLTLDGTEYVVVGIERSGVGSQGRIETKLRLHARTRYTFTSLTTTVPRRKVVSLPDIVEAPASAVALGKGAAITPRVAGEGISAFALVTMRDDGLLYMARSWYEDQGKIIGMSLNSGSTGKVIEVQRSGRVVIGDALGSIDPGTRLYLRTADLLDVTHKNVYDLPLLAGTMNENLFVEVGTMETDGALNLSITNGFVYHPIISEA